MIDDRIDGIEADIDEIAELVAQKLKMFRFAASENNNSVNVCRFQQVKAVRGNELRKGKGIFDKIAVSKRLLLNRPIDAVEERVVVDIP